MIVQTAILIFIIYGFYDLTTKGDQRKHGIIFSVATITNLISLIAVMIPVMIDEWSSLVQNPFGFTSFIVIVHHLMGLVAAVLSVIIVVSWGNRDLPEWDSRGRAGRTCLGAGRTGRIIMRSTFILWVASFALGAVIYGADILGIS